MNFSPDFNSLNLAQKEQFFAEMLKNILNSEKNAEFMI